MEHWNCLFIHTHPQLSATHYPISTNSHLNNPRPKIYDSRVKSDNDKTENSQELIRDRRATITICLQIVIAGPHALTARCGAVFDGDDVHVAIKWRWRCEGRGEEEGEGEGEEGR